MGDVLQFIFLGCPFNNLVVTHYNQLLIEMSLKLVY